MMSAEANQRSFRGVLSTLLLVSTFITVSAQVKVQNLLVENLSNPVGLNESKPRLSWQLWSDKRDIAQAAYEVRVTNADNGSEVVWSSGKVSSDSNIHVLYKGPALKAGSKYSWQVRIWDNKGGGTAWSTPATFQMALLSRGDWKASWISSGIAADTVNGIVPVFRKTFSTSKKIKSATVSATSRGVYEAFINGKRVGDAYLAPGWTSYNKHLQFQTYDVTTLVTQGKNAIGVRLGSGWYRTRLAWLNNQNIYGKETALLFQLDITYSDGTKESVLSDGSWKVTPSEITYSEIYDGEIQDSRKQLSNWTAAAYDDNAWKPVVSKDFPFDNLVAAINEPIRKHETFKPVKVLKTPKGETVLDFGQNLVGWVQLKANGKAGDKITLSHVEMMDKFGNPYFDNLRTAKAQAVYILKGGAVETLEPHFTFFGFRYVRVEGLASVNPADFTAIALYSDMKQTGTFECSNPLVNQLQKNIQWGQRGNFLDVPTDCPQRDERLGWTGDAEVFSRTAAFNFNVNQFFAKWLKDVTADQEDNGSVPFVIPNALKGSNFFGKPVGAAGWSDASIIIPWNMYIVYGDKKIVERQYPTMQRYLNYMRDASTNDLWNTGFQFADWLSYRVDDSKGMIGQKSAVTDNYLVAQCFFAYSADLMIKSAKLLNKPDDVKEYEALAKRIRAAFQKEYMTSSGRLISETQTAYVLALQFDMLPESLRAQAADRLETNIKSYEYHLTTGFLGTPFLSHVLTRFGKNDVAYKLLLQDTYPSWLFPVKMGATTIWERWDSQKPDSTFQDPGMTSFNHYAYGAVGDWMYRTITGIDNEEGSVAYKQIKIKPQPGGNLTWASATLESYNGKIKSYWKIDGGKMTMNVDIPVNTTATLYIPAASSGDILESGKPLSAAQVKGTKDGYVEVKVGSGSYQFSVAKK